MTVTGLTILQRRRLLAELYPGLHGYLKFVSSELVAPLVEGRSEEDLERLQAALEEAIDNAEPPSFPLPPPERHDAFAGGAPVAREEYYLRGNPTFEVPNGKHDWLTKHVFVGVGERRSDGNLLRYYALV